MANYKRRFTILGCGSSPGVPRPHSDWGACDPANQKNRRLRTAFMVEQIAPDGGLTVVIIDTGPDFRQQMIHNKVSRVDAVLYTHAHADHLHGIDDLRTYFLLQKHRIPIYADPYAMERIYQGFGYCLETPPGGSYPPIVKPNVISRDMASLTIHGPGGPITFDPLEQVHGDILSLGFRIGDVAYCSDVSDFPQATIAKLEKLDVLVVDALQYKTHPSHFSLGESLRWIDRLAPKRAILTHMHLPLDYDTVMAQTPEHVEPGYDGLSFDVDFSYGTL